MRQSTQLKCNSIVTRARASCSSRSRSERAAAVAYYKMRMKECSTLNIAVKNNNRCSTQVNKKNALSNIQKCGSCDQTCRLTTQNPYSTNIKAAAVLKKDFPQSLASHLKSLRLITSRNLIEDAITISVNYSRLRYITVLHVTT